VLNIEAAKVAMSEKNKDDDSNDGVGLDSTKQDSIRDSEAESDVTEDHGNPAKLGTENKGMLILDATVRQVIYATRLT
jgi:hypothetical protein